LAPRPPGRVCRWRRSAPFFEPPLEWRQNCSPRHDPAERAFFEPLIGMRVSAGCVRRTRIRRTLGGPPACPCGSAAHRPGNGFSAPAGHGSEAGCRSRDLSARCRKRRDVLAARFGGEHGTACESARFCQLSASRQRAGVQLSCVSPHG